MNLRNNRNFIVNLAALILGGASLALQSAYINNKNTAYKLLIKHREETLLRREEALVRGESDLAARKADFALQKIKEVKSNLPEIKQNSVFDFISQLFDSAWDFAISLDIYQTTALLNILVLTAIILALVNIFSVYLSDFYISKFQLEKRYPKLAIFFKARQIFIKGNILLYTFGLVFVLIYGLVLNIIMFYY